MTVETKQAFACRTPVGRPPKWTDPKEIDDKITEYQEWCMANNEPFLMTGLAIYLGTWRDQLSVYSKIPIFSAVFQRARNLSEHTFVRNLAIGKNNPIGSLFLLKNWHGYRDQQDIVHRHETIQDVLGKADGRVVIDGEIVEVGVLAEPQTDKASEIV